MNLKSVTLTIAVVFASCTIVLAQPPGGGGANRAQMQAMMKQKLKDEAKLTDVEADSVAAIQKDFQMASRPIKMDQSLSDDDKKAKMKALQNVRETRLAANLSADKLKQVKDMYENMQKNMQKRRNEGGGSEKPMMPPPNN